MSQEMRKVLIIDDDQVNSIALAKRLSRRGFAATVASDEEFSLQMLHDRQIEAILLDIVMPKRDGLTILEEIRTVYSPSQLPILMVTAMEGSDDVVESFKMGANDYITKPVNIDIVVARMQAQLSVVDLQRESLQKRELEAVQAMVVTYNHEINNPLAIAMAAVGDMKSSDEFQQIRIDRATRALDRIASIVAKIAKLRESEDIHYETYAGEAKMVKAK